MARWKQNVQNRTYITIIIHERNNKNYDHQQQHNSLCLISNVPPFFSVFDSPSTFRNTSICRVIVTQSSHHSFVRHSSVTPGFSEEESFRYSRVIHLYDMPKSYHSCSLHLHRAQQKNTSCFENKIKFGSELYTVFVICALQNRVQGHRKRWTGFETAIT